MIIKNDGVDYSNVSDNELVCLCKDDNSVLPYILVRYAKSILIKAIKFSTNYSAEVDDLLQEGMLALIKAVDSFNPDKGCAFSTFADVCIGNRMKSVVLKQFNVQKADEILADDQSAEVFVSDNPEDILIEREKMKELYDVISSNLSHFEWNVLRLFLDGFSYSNIALELKVTEKSVDNALIRIRKKLRAVLPNLF